MPLSSLPALNASLNALSACLLALGWVFIRRRAIGLHKAAMLGAFASSSTFLAFYLYYHAHVGSKHYAGPGRPVYLAILLSHTVLAAAVLPFILRALYLAWHDRFDAHAWWARRALPAWLYVSVTGVVVYWMLYRL
jgi:putative membrane protein